MLACCAASPAARRRTAGCTECIRSCVPTPPNCSPTLVRSRRMPAAGRNSAASTAGEPGRALLCECRDPFGEVGGLGALLLHACLELELGGHPVEQPPVQLPF